MRRIRSRGKANRSMSCSTSATSPWSATTNFHHAPRLRKSRIASGLIRLASGTPELASFSDTFHWSTGTGGGGRIPEVSTSTVKPRAFRASTSATKSDDSSGSPPVMTARRHGNAPGFPSQRLERHLMPASRIPGVLGVAPAASHGTPLKPDEDRRHAGSDTLPLDGEEALGDTASGRGSHARSRLISAEHVGVSRITARSSTMPEGRP